jgi:hypothetical protein
MKTSCICILVFIISGSLLKPINKNDYKKMNLNGFVKSIVQIAYGVNEKDGKIVRDSGSIFSFAPTRLYFFDGNGNLTEEREEYPDGSLPTKTVFLYDDKGNEIENILYRHNREKEVQDTTTSRYDDNGNKIEEKYSGFVKQKRTYLYDDKGHLIEMNLTTFSSRGNVNTKTVYNYDIIGNMVEESEYRSTSEFIKNIKYSFDEKRNKTEMQEFILNGILKSKGTYKYDEMNNAIEENVYGSNGNILKSTAYNYEYDGHNNWIKVLIFENKILKAIAERKIEYYK